MEDLEQFRVVLPTSGLIYFCLHEGMDTEPY